MHILYLLQQNIHKKYTNNGRFFRYNIPEGILEDIYNKGYTDCIYYINNVILLQITKSYDNSFSLYIKKYVSRKVVEIRIIRRPLTLIAFVNIVNRFVFNR